MKTMTLDLDIRLCRNNGIELSTHDRIIDKGPLQNPVLF